MNLYRSAHTYTHIYTTKGTQIPSFQEPPPLHTQTCEYTHRIKQTKKYTITYTHNDIQTQTNTYAYTYTQGNIHTLIHTHPATTHIPTQRYKHKHKNKHTHKYMHNWEQTHTYTQTHKQIHTGRENGIKTYSCTQTQIQN